MMKKPIRVIHILLIVITIIFVSITPLFAANATDMPFVIYETKDSQYIGSGILHENIKKFTSKGWWNINLVRVDLANQWAYVGGLYSNDGLSKSDKVSKMVTDRKAVAGINGDFFNLTPVASSLGILIDKNSIISLDAIAKETNSTLPSFYIDNDGMGHIGFFDRSMVVRSLNSGNEQAIHLVNKGVNYSAVTLLDKHWGAKSIGNSFFNDVLEMLIVENEIRDIRIGQEPVSIPENGYVITARGPYKDNLLNSFYLGDVVELDIDTDPNLDNVKFAIGGGSIIVKDGIIANSNIDIKGDQPRTGVGITKDGRELIIATIDGRDNSYKGVSQEVFGTILRDLGAHNAINLDGGGSTTMAIVKGF